MADAAPTISELRPEPTGQRARPRRSWSSRTTRAMRMMLREALEEDGYTRRGRRRGGRAGIERVQAGRRRPGRSPTSRCRTSTGSTCCARSRPSAPSPHVITITAFGSIDTAIRAVKLGAFDYITKPFDVDQLILSVAEGAGRARAALASSRGCATRSQRSYRWGNIIGKSAAMQEMFALIRRLSRLDGVGAGHGRVGDRQGAGREGAALQQPARATGRSSPSTAPPSPRRCSRASCSATSAARSPTRAPIAPACSSRPTAARSSSTRSPSCRRRCRRSCCACCRRARSGRWARRAARRSTCASSRPPTRISRSAWRAARSARTCTTG